MLSLLAEWIIAGATVAAVALRPRSWAAGGLAAALAAVDVGVEGDRALGAAVHSVWPMLALVTATLSVSALAVRMGVAGWAATRLAALARGSAARLFALACIACALLTACLTLDGAVVLLAPVVVDLHRRFGAPRRALLLGIVTVANACSAAVPTGNPTNLVVLGRLGVGLGEATARLLPAAIAAAALCALAVMITEREALRTRLHAARGSAERPRIGAGSLASVVRIALQIVALLVVLLTALRPGQLAVAGLAGAVGLGLVVALAAALVNNLPASAIAAVTLAPGRAAYAALIGLTVGALATPHGSVATLIAGDLVGEHPHARVLLPAALAATAAAVVLAWLLP